MNGKKKQLWMRFAAIFTIIWIGFVVVMTKGDAEHWLNNAMFLLPIAIWAVILFVFKKPDRDV